MSVEKVLRGIGDPHATQLADAFHDYERAQSDGMRTLQVEVDKSVNRSTFGMAVSLLVLAAIVSGTLYLGEQLGALKERASAAEQRLGQVEANLKTLGETLDAIDARTKRIEDKQKASIEPGAGPIVGEDTLKLQSIDLALLSRKSLELVNQFGVDKIEWSKFVAALSDRLRGGATLTKPDIREVASDYFDAKDYATVGFAAKTLAAESFTDASFSNSMGTWGLLYLFGIGAALAPTIDEFAPPKVLVPTKPVEPTTPKSP